MSSVPEGANPRKAVGRRRELARIRRSANERTTGTGDTILKEEGRAMRERPNENR